ncbi:alpha/beta hydrolase family protein [Phormidium sp. CCY1219]|uniref:alpha/beta hydrolase family protein n=1 Tax=Phormidium sp. CCY1219 TaxID=2886104 RepID=UPI002D1F4943|nr:chlorophyllase [Phormidium sp. CCY1219]MEB3829365.1 chlorophyllase [Phormidium sp. CCY1219]
MTLIASRGSCVAVIGAVLLAGCTNLPVVATTPEPLFDTVTRFETTIPTANGAEDAADIYYPGASEAVSLPLALLLPGGLVDKAEYSDFASMVAGYGFVVVVPNRFRSVPNPVSGEDFSGLIAQVEQVNDVLNYVEAENARPESPLRDRVDVSQLGLLGHSWGGAVGLAAIQNLCLPLLCTESFERPKALKAGVFYGTTFRDQSQEEVVILPVANQGIPIGLIAGDRDGVVRGAMDAVAQTYENIQDPPKALITLRGANHYSITNEDSNRDRVRSTLDQEVATETIARWSGLFLRAHLLEDSEAWNYIYQSGDRLDPNVDVESIP